MKHLLIRNVRCLVASPQGSLRAWDSYIALNGSGNKQRSARIARNVRSFHASTKYRAVVPYLLADIGEGITECQITEWFVGPGDRVEQFDRICEVQSDKASVEITSRFDGIIKELHYGTDDMAIVGKPLLDIDIDKIEDAEADFTSDSSENKDTGEQQMRGGIQSTAGPQAVRELNDKGGERQASVSASTVLPRIDDALHAPPTQRTPLRSRNGSGSIATPGVRHMIDSIGLDINAINGTGKDGRVRKEDVEKYILSSSSSTVAVPSSNSVVYNPATTPAAEDKTIPFTPIEKQMFKIMTHSLTIPHFLYSHPVNFTPLNTLRKRINSSPSLHLSETTPPLKLTTLPFILKALSIAFTHFPKLNAHLSVDSNTSSEPSLTQKATHNIGIAIDTPLGLLVPVIHDVQSRSVSSLAAEISRLSSLAKEGKLAPGDFRDATFTVSNIGSIGGGVVSPVIVSPMVGILGVGRVRRVPVWEEEEDEGKVGVREEAVLSWSADHRVLDGAVVARCAEMVGKILQDFAIYGEVL